MAYTTIDKSSLHFNSKPYSGGSAPNAITGVGFKPDFIWIKPRNLANSNRLHASLLTDTDYYVMSENTDAEATNNNCITSFDTDGFTLGNTDNGWNDSSYNYASWNWKAAGTSGSANSDGSISSTVSVNSTSKMSIVKWTGTGSNATVGHGLGVAPEVVMCKRLNGGTQNWYVFHKGMFDTDSTAYINLNGTDGKSQSSGPFNSTAPTSTVFSTGTSFASSDYIAFCFSNLTGFFKSGLYTGNGSTDGTFIYTGFKPELIIMKQYGANGQGWCMKTNSLNERVGNPNDYFLKADTYDSENTFTSFQIDMVSNGFKLRNTDGIMNTSGSGYLYMAWAKAPLVGSNNVPCTAR